MFQKDGLNALYREHKGTLKMAHDVGAALKGRFFDMDDAVDCLMIAAISGEAMVMIGPPGTAKSRLVRSFCHLIGLIDDEDIVAHSEGASLASLHADYFEYLLTQFTEPSELFGYYDIGLLTKHGKMERLDENMMSKAKVVFLDEVFNASSAILNALLTFMNERKFHDRGKVHNVPLRMLIGATNFPPTDRTLSAVYDRFLLRVRMHNVAAPAVSQGEIVDLLKVGWQETHSTVIKREEKWSGLLGGLQEFQVDLDNKTSSGELKIDENHPVFNALGVVVKTMVGAGLSDMSNRRIVKLSGLALAMCLLRGAGEGRKEVEISTRDLDVFTRFSLDREDPSWPSLLKQQLENAGVSG